MVVRCYVQGCPYNTQSHFCRNRMLVLNPNGQCEHIYGKDGQVKANWQAPVQPEKMEGYKGE